MAKLFKIYQIKALKFCIFKQINPMKNPVLITKKEILTRYKPIAKDTHKGIQGHVLLIGGSYGKIGSICLISKAALKAGLSCFFLNSLMRRAGTLPTSANMTAVLPCNDSKSGL